MVCCLKLKEDLILGYFLGPAIRLLQSVESFSDMLCGREIIVSSGEIFVWEWMFKSMTLDILSGKQLSAIFSSFSFPYSLFSSHMLIFQAWL